MLTASEQEAITSFLARYFGPVLPMSPLTSTEEVAIATLVAEVVQRAQGTRYLLGSAIDYLLMAEKLSQFDTEAKSFRPGLTEAALFTRYTRVTEKAGQTLNTLTLRFGTLTEVGMRDLENQMVTWFHMLKRQYPSSAPYATGQWQKSKGLLVACFQLSTAGRRAAATQLLEAGLLLFPASKLTGRAVARPRLFTLLLAHYPRRAAGENGGLTLQALTYGFFYADRQHLELVVGKVRTGAVHQSRVGDVDGYYGLDLALTVEVKDMKLTTTNWPGQLTVFINKTSQTPDATALVVAAELEEASRQELVARGIIPLSVAELSQAVNVWDWPKQDRAVHAVLHYLAHIEQSPAAVQRLLDFIQLHDAAHDSLAGLPPAPAA